jgi:hypothetical protein
VDASTQEFDASTSADAGQGRLDASSAPDAETLGLDAGVDGGVDAGAAADASSGNPDGGCFLTTVGVWGDCLDTSACAAMSGYISTPGFCPGPANIQCCTEAPNVANNPPVPSGWVLMQQSAVTSAMTAWAVQILNDPVTYPMWSTTIQVFGTQTVMARVEWHPPDFQNSVVHRGVTLYVPG